MSRLRSHDLSIDRSFHNRIDIDPTTIVGHPDPNPISLFLRTYLDGPDLLLPRTPALVRTFNPVIHSVAHEVKKRLLQSVHDPAIELSIPGVYPHSDDFAK